MRVLPWQQMPDAPALVHDSVVWTRGQVAESAAAGAALLETHGVGVGTVCATVLHPGVEGVLGVAAALASVGVVSPLSPGLSDVEMGEALRLLQPVVLLVEPATQLRASAAVETLPSRLRPAMVMVTGGPLTPGSGRLLQLHAAGETSSVGGLPPEGKLVIWTSGTTGAPRAVLLAESGVLGAARSQAAHMRLAVGDHLPATLALSSVGGFMIPLRAALGGAVVIATGPFDAGATVRLLRHGVAQHLSLVPVMLRRVVERLELSGAVTADPGTVRTVLVGGAPCPPSLVERANRVGLPVSLTWGMTESCAQAATATAEASREDPTSVGRPLDHVRVRTDSVGRLQLYLSELDPTELVRVGDGELRARALTDRDGWFTTGDFGEVGSDGRVRVFGRTSDRIISGGVNVDPVEVERRLLEHAAVAEVAVVGLPDAEWGERVAAAIVPAGGGVTGVRRLAPELVQELEAHVRNLLAAPKRPRAWAGLATLPRTAAGKVDRSAVRRQLEGRVEGD